ncbi:hypothetical protein ABHQ57_01710 [Tenacibaculum sp. ZH5_bin.1]|uniref:hypothetical protein n=1 Tax=Tenacibaculum TaxID=104267 RepID=UPI001431627C|nr:hypothetical protein [Tenacibaculum mesophilum]KAF9659147.1 hypothetical protein HBA12_02560 [Tenacibaculum mesophilum]
MKNLESFGVQELNSKEIKKIDGGVIGLIASAFWAGVAYGYVKEKVESGQWEI